MEYLDILDENGNKTGEVKTRKEVHAKGLWYKAVHVWIINSKNQLLVQLRSAKKISHPNMWDISAAGHISAGDDSITTCIKETKEELGLNFTEADFEFLFNIKTQNIQNHGTFLNNGYHDIYLVRRNVELDELTLQKEEVAEVKFINIEELKNIIKEKHPDFIIHTEEYKRLFEHLDRANQ
jgi:isopentenyl-diphosphate Delta-isomerase